jgi:hypothetical protein
MTNKSAFTDEEWHLVVQGPPTAGIIVVTAQRGGTFRETVSIAKAYTEARQQHGDSELLDEIVSARPELDRTRTHSPQELRDHGLQHLRDAVAAVAAKATAQELDDYRRFTKDLAERVAHAHRDRGTADGVSDAEQEALTEIATALGS